MRDMRSLRLVLLVSALTLLGAVPAYSSQGGDILALAIDPVTPTTLYAAMDSGGLFKTTDGGANWSATGLTNISVLALAIDPLTPTTLYAGVYGGLFKSTDGGASWSATGLTGIDVYSLAIDPLTPTTLYAGTQGAVRKSTDGGASWNTTGSLISAGSLYIETGVVSSLAIDPATPATLYAAMNVSAFNYYGLSTGPTTGGIYKSTNGGAIWSLIWSFGPVENDGSGGMGFSCGPCGGVLALAIDPSISTTFFAVTDGLVLYNYWGDVVVWTQPGFVITSTGGGWTPWPDVIDPISIPGLAIAPRADPLAPATLYVGSTDVFKSTDGGASFSPTGLTGVGSALSLAIDRRTPTTIYAGTSGASVFKSTDGGARWSATGQMPWLHVSSLSLNPSSVVGGSSSTGTVTLSAAAPAGGAEVTLSTIENPDNPPVASVPTSVTVPAGATSADFTVSTTPLPVGASAIVAIRGLYRGVVSAATLIVTSASSLSALSLDPSSVRGGAPSIGTVTLSAAAPTGGAVVALASSDSAASVPASVAVPPGATSANFTISTNSVTAPTRVAILAANLSAVLTVTPSTLSALSLSPTSVRGGTASIGTVTLSEAAPIAGAVVPLASSNTAVASVPPSVTVPAGTTSATFTISTSLVTTGTSVTIQAANLSAVLNVTPATTLSTLSLNPASVIAGDSSSGTVTMSAPAPVGGAVVALSSSNPMAAVPTSVTVAAGATSATFTVPTSTPAACASSVATISATYDGATRSADLTVTPTTDTITIQQADYFAYKRQLRVGAKSTGSSATLQVYVTSTGALIGTLQNLGDGRYTGQFSWPANPQSIAVRSSLCGSATKTVTTK